MVVKRQIAPSCPWRYSPLYLLILQRGRFLGLINPPEACRGSCESSNNRCQCRYNHHNFNLHTRILLPRNYFISNRSDKRRDIKPYLAFFFRINNPSKNAINLWPSLVIIVICHSVDNVNAMPSEYSLSHASLNTSASTMVTRNADRTMNAPLRSLFRFASLLHGLLGGAMGALSATMT